MTSRRPYVLTEEERLRRLALLGRAGDLSPLTPHPLERLPMDTPTTTVTDTTTPAGPAAGAVLRQGWVQTLTLAGVLAAAALAASEAGVLPGWVGAVAQAVIGLLAAAGIASPGIRRKA